MIAEGMPVHHIGTELGKHLRKTENLSSSGSRQIATATGLDRWQQPLLWGQSGGGGMITRWQGSLMGSPQQINRWLLGQLGINELPDENLSSASDMGVEVVTEVEQAEHHLREGGFSKLAKNA
jgi:hypothetical protein